MSNQSYWLIFSLITILSLIYFNLILFLISLIIVSIIAIILALEVNSRDLKLINYFKNNQLYELDNEINLIGRDDLGTSFFNLFNSLSSKTSPIQQLLNRKQNSYQQKFNNLNDDKTNELFTGDSKIDEQINDLINLILRDYIYSWYSDLSSNQEFVNELKSIIQTIIRILAIRISKIDKINYITKNITNNFVNHLKLYRLSKHYLKSNNLELTDDNLKRSFFNFELQSESNRFCRNAVSEDNEFTIKYLTELTNILEYLILPPDLFNNRTIKYLVNNLLINSTFCPLLDLLSDSDFINQSLISFCKSRKLNISLSESFLIILRSCANKDELNAVLEKVREETALQRSKDTGGSKDFEIKQQLSSLNYVNSVIKERLKLLNDGCLDQLDKVNHEENNNFNSQKNDLVSLTFDFVLTNPLALTYFFEYMITINKQSYLNFYLSVEGFRVSIEQKLVSIQMKESEELIRKNEFQDTDDEESEDNVDKNDLTEKEIIQLNNELNDEFFKEEEQKSTKNNKDDKLIKKLENRMKNKLQKLKKDNEKAEWLNQIENRAREEARNIYDTYLSSNSSSKHRIMIDDTFIQDLKRKIDYEELSETWFDTIHSLVYRRLREEEQFFNSFKKSIHYYKLLKELGLLKSNNLKDKNLLNQLNNNKTNSINTQPQPQNKNINFFIDTDNTSIKSNHSSNDTESLNSLHNDSNKIKLNEQQDLNQQNKDEIIELNDKSIIELDADITSTGITKEFGKEYGVYIIDINRKDYQNEQTDKFKETNWCVIRRYSDFYTFHQLTIKLFPQLNKFNLPSKKVFSNMNQEFLEQRKQSLNLYLKNLLTLLNNNDNQDQLNLDKFKLREHILQFFESGNYVPKPIKSTTNNQILTKTMNSVFNPFKSISSKSKSGFTKIKPFGSNNSSNTANSNQIDKQKLQINELKSSFSSSSLSNLQTNQQQPNLSPKIQSNHHSNQTNSTNLNDNDLTSAKLKSTNGIYLESETNIPLRILLLLMDEIFDLKSKSFWLRRRIFNVIVKQIIQTTYGNLINRKIISWINRLFSPTSIESYIRTIKKTLFPNGYRALPPPERDIETKLRTKIATKMLLLSIIPDDLLSIIGSETSRKSVIGLFNMLQHDTLNRRLVIVIFETFLIQLFPDNQLDKVFERLHSLGTKHKDKIDNTDLIWPPYLMNINSNISSKDSNSDQSSKTSPIFRYQS